MIEKCLAEVKFRLDNVEEMNGSSHTSPYVIFPSEEELIMGGDYEKSIPGDYPKTEIEGRFNLRRINTPAKALYKGLGLRVGKTTLHIKEAGTDKNIESVIMVYTGSADEFKPVEGAPTKAMTASEISSVLLLETGVISGAYFLFNGVAHVCSWSPPGKEGFAGHAYPADRGDVAAAMFPALMASGTPMGSPSFLALPELVMLAVESYRKAGGENSSIIQ